MRIGIDLFSLVPGVGRGGGFHRYATGLIAALEELDDGHQYVLFVNRLNKGSFPSGGRFTQVVVPLPPQRTLWPFRLLWQHLCLPVVGRVLRLDIMHYPMDVASALPGRPYVVTVHDVIADVFYPAHYPGAVSRLKAQYLFRSKRRSARKARRVICPSQATAEQICAAYGVDRANVTVLPEAPAPHFSAPCEPSQTGASHKYILSVVSLSHHKNVESLIQAFARARKKFGIPHELRIIGMRGVGWQKIEPYLFNQLARGLPVYYLGYVDEDRLARAYRGASLFVFVPYVEGFGLPPLEAMATGVPVIASQVPSLIAVCGDAALMVPPDDVEAIAEAIGSVLQDPPRGRDLKEAGLRRARAFSWTKTAADTQAVYEQALQPLRLATRT